MTRCAALILAGGRSRRMGRDKALLPLPNQDHKQSLTILQRTCNIAQDCNMLTYVLTPWPERYAGLLSSVVLLQETLLNGGPLLALNQGWSMITTDCERRQLPPFDWLLLLACDMPALDSPTLQSWYTELVTIDAIAALPHHQDRWEPLCGFYHRRCRPSLQAAISANVRSFQQWLTHEAVQALPVNNCSMLRNCNTPEQWQQFLASKPEQ